MRRQTSDLGVEQPTVEVQCPEPESLYPVLYYITDRLAFVGDESVRRRRLLEKIAEATRAGVDYIQLREKDLTANDLERLARQAINVMAEITQLALGNGQRATALLINSRTDVALAADAAGVHLRSDDILPAEVKAIWKSSKCCANTPFDKLRANSASHLSPRPPIVAVSCHSPAETVQAAANGANFSVFAPVFGKKDASGNRPAGIAQLREACRAKIPVLALGGITLENAKDCLAAGAAGIAAIRLFQENDIATVVQKLRR